MARHPQMSDIRANLAGTASFGLRTATDRSIATPADALSFVHNQVAGALMGRRLIFCVDDVPRLYCDVARCRLMRFTVLCPNEAIIAEEYFDDMSNSEQVKAKLNTLAYSILEFCEAGALIAVQPQPLLDAADPTHGGVAASSLAVAFGLESDMRATWTPVEALNTFLTEAGTAVIASAHMNEDLLYPITGEDEHIDILAAKLEWILDDLDGDQSGMPTVLPVGGLLCLGYGPGAAHHIAVANVDGCRMFALIQPGAAPLLVSIWQGHRIHR